MSEGIDINQFRAEQNEQVQELERQLKEKDQILEQYKSSKGKLDVFFKQVLNSISPIEPLPSLFEKFYKPNIAGSEVVAVKQTSDVHMGATQEAYEVEGFNSFNPEICKNRSLGFSKSHTNYVNAMRNAYNIKKLHWLFTGDNISGDIHDELKITNAFPTPVQVYEVAKLFAKQIALTSPNYEEVVLDFLTEDNHARLTKKPQASEAGMNSMNYLVGVLTKEMVRNIPNVVFNIHALHEKVIHISNIKYLIKHGHGTKSWMGIPWYGIERAVGRESTSRMQLILRDLERSKEIGFNKIIHGHYHVNFDTPMYACSPSVQGTTAYDHQAGRYAEPGQVGWLVHPKHGEFARTVFNLNIFDNEKFD